MVKFCKECNIEIDYVQDCETGYHADCYCFTCEKGESKCICPQVQQPGGKDDGYPPFSIMYKD